MSAPVATHPERDWFEYHDNLVLVAKYMAYAGAKADDVAYMIEKPWKYAEEFVAAQRWSREDDA